MYLQVVEIRLEALDTDDVHPFGHAPDEAGALVRSEVESARLLEVLEDLLELLIGDLF